ncbi:MAG: hypothetical protein MZV64_33400 [Ignavibacteriales bacterium]|nr:hypothetical protein [Ignavibacteriales bacterium]
MSKMLLIKIFFLSWLIPIDSQALKSFLRHEVVPSEISTAEINLSGVETKTFFPSLTGQQAAGE